MVPEISHRCPSCGVSVRNRDALFCPECGKPLSTEPKTTEATDFPDSSTQPEAGEIVEVSPALVNEAPAPVLTESIAAETTSAAAATDMKDDSSVLPAHRRGEKARERLHRASEVARGVGRGVIEEPAKRVEKIRHASTV